MKALKVKESLLIATLLVSSGLMSQSVMASPNSGWIDKKQKHQKHKIIRGVKSGDLTRKETWRLGKQQRRIYLKERRFKADGNFTRRERAKIHRDLARASRSIYRAKHN
jgi:hypothetical protein